MLKKNALLRALLAAGLTTGLAACGGGSSDGETTEGVSGSGDTGGSGANTETVVYTEGKGQFVDSPVQGLRYVTPTKSGTTNANGEFDYTAGEEISFYVGNSPLGQLMAGPIITPMEMADETSNEDHVDNILRFLQTMDEDGDPSNGIVISESTIAYAETQGVKIDFNKSASDFETSAGGFLSTVERAEFISTEDAQKHFNETLATNKVDIRGEWIATSVYRLNGEQHCKASATYTFTDSGISIKGDEMETNTNGDSTVDCKLVAFTFNGDYSNQDLGSSPGAGCTSGICTLDQLNRTIDKWDYEERTSSWEGDTVNSKLYSKVELKHTIGADTMVRIKTDKTEFENTGTGQTGTNTYGVSTTTFLRKEAAEYTKDMRGTWNKKATRSSCPGTEALQSLTYTDTHIIIEGNELNSENGECVIKPMNETVSYDALEVPADICGPVCTYGELNGTYFDENETIKLSHKRGSDFIFRTKGDSREVWEKTN